VHIVAKLRMDGTDLRTNMARTTNAVRLVAVVTSQELDQTVGSSAWEWIVCGQTSVSAGHSTYKACQNEADPDNQHAVNIRNPAVLDAHVFEIGGPGCCEQSQVPGAEFGRTLHWKPQISQDLESTHPMWLYVYFMVGDSRACATYNCDESAVYSEMGAHMRSYDVVSQPARLVMLPGTSITYTLPGHVAASTVPHSSASRRRAVRIPLLRATHVVVPQRVAPVRVGRKLLVAGSNNPPPTNANTTAAHRVITSLNNDAQVIQAVCSGRTHNCSMLNVEMSIPVKDYCLSEAVLMSQYAPGLVNAIADMSIGESVKFFSVVSILRPRFASACAPSAQDGRRLLQQTDDIATDFEAVFVSVSNDDMYLMLSEENQAKYNIKAIQLRLTGNGEINSDATVISVCKTDECRNQILTDKNFKQTDAGETMQSLDTLEDLMQASMALGTDMTMEEDSSDDNNTTVLIAGIALAAVVLIAVVAVLVYSKTRAPTGDQEYMQAPMHPMMPQHIMPDMGQNPSIMNNQNLTQNPLPNIIQNPGQNMMQNLGQNMMQTPGQNMMQNPAQNMMQSRGQNMMQNPGQDPMQNPGQNMMQPPGQNMMQPPGQNMMPNMTQNPTFGQMPSYNNGMRFYNNTSHIPQHGYSFGQQSTYNY